MSKEHIKDWQRALKAAGKYTGNIDGDFGRGTLGASMSLVALGYGLPRKQLRHPILYMQNRQATRNLPIQDTLAENIRKCVYDTWPEACEAGHIAIFVYSGGQPAIGTPGAKRTGSIRHDVTSDGKGRAADCYIMYRGRRISGLELARLAQNWLAKGYGGVGIEMATGGIHLDNWTTPPKGGGMFWTYAYSNRKPWGAKARQMLEAGAHGELAPIREIR